MEVSRVVRALRIRWARLVHNFLNFARSEEVGGDWHLHAGWNLEVAPIDLFPDRISLSMSLSKDQTRLKVRGLFLFDDLNYIGQTGTKFVGRVKISRQFGKSI